MHFSGVIIDFLKWFVVFGVSWWCSRQTDDYAVPAVAIPDSTRAPIHPLFWRRVPRDLRAAISMRKPPNMMTNRYSPYCSGQYHWICFCQHIDWLVSCYDRDLFNVNVANHVPNNPQHCDMTMCGHCDMTMCGHWVSLFSKRGNNEAMLSWNHCRLFSDVWYADQVMFTSLSQFSISQTYSSQYYSCLRSKLGSSWSFVASNRITFLMYFITKLFLISKKTTVFINANVVLVDI